MILSCRPYYSEIEGGRTGHDGKTSAYEKILYPYHICQGAEYHHSNGKGTGGEICMKLNTRPCMEAGTCSWMETVIGEL